MKKPNSGISEEQKLLILAEKKLLHIHVIRITEKRNPKVFSTNKEC